MFHVATLVVVLDVRRGVGLAASFRPSLQCVISLRGGDRSSPRWVFWLVVVDASVTGSFLQEGVLALCKPFSLWVRWSTFVWPLTFDLSSMGGPTRSIRSRWCSSPGHWDTQAVTPRQGVDHTTSVTLIKEHVKCPICLKTSPSFNYIISEQIIMQHCYHSGFRDDKYSHAIYVI